MSLEGRSIGNYVIRSKLGEGGMGAVYLGEHPLIGKKVAVKILKQELGSNAEIVRRFFNEARAVNDIRHENIVDIVDFGKVPAENGGEIAYIIMEYLDGESLSSRLRSVGLRVPEVVDVMRQCCSALAASHKKGIIHRDLKPENIFLCPRGGTRNFTKVLDFGIAKLTGDGHTSQTRTGSVMGTPYYMSPEQCEGRRQIDHRSDIYSLGVVMYELLTGQVPFPDEGFGAIIVAHLTRPVPLPRTVRPGVPPELEAVVMRALEKDPAQRFQTMEELDAALGDPAWYGATVAQRASAQMATIMGDSGRGAAIGASGPRPITTLSGAASELSQPVPLLPAERQAGSSAAMWAVLGLLAVGGAGGGAWYLRGASTTQSASAPAASTDHAAALVPAAPEKIQILFTSEPSGAKVLRPDGTVIGSTPLKLTVDKDSSDFDVAIVLSGYQEQRRRVTPDGGKELQITLLANVAPVVAAPAPAHGAHHSSHHSSAPKSAGDAIVDDARLLRSSLLDDEPKKK